MRFDAPFFRVSNAPVQVDSMAEYDHPIVGRVRVPANATQQELATITADLDRQAGQAMAYRAALDPLARVAMELANPRPRPRPVGKVAAFAMSPQQLSDIQRQRQGAYEFDQNEALQREELARREAMQQQELDARSQLQQQQIGALTKHYENMTNLEKMRYEAQEKRAEVAAKAKVDADEIKRGEPKIVKGADGNEYLRRFDPKTNTIVESFWKAGKPEKGVAEKPKEPKYVTRTYIETDPNSPYLGKAVERRMTEAESYDLGATLRPETGSSANKSPEEISLKAAILEANTRAKDLTRLGNINKELNLIDIEQAKLLKKAPKIDPVTGESSKSTLSPGENAEIRRLGALRQNKLNTKAQIEADIAGGGVQRGGPAASLPPDLLVPSGGPQQSAPGQPGRVRVWDPKTKKLSP